MISPLLTKISFTYILMAKTALYARSDLKSDLGYHIYKGTNNNWNYLLSILSHTSYIKDKNEIIHKHSKEIRNIHIYLKQKRLIKHSFSDDLVERGEKLDLLVDKTDNLSATAVTFKTTARTVHHKMWWKNIRYDIILGKFSEFFGYRTKV